MYGESNMEIYTLSCVKQIAKEICCVTQGSQTRTL